MLSLTLNKVSVASASNNVKIFWSLNAMMTQVSQKNICSFVRSSVRPFVDLKLWFPSQCSDDAETWEMTQNVLSHLNSHMEIWTRKPKFETFWATPRAPKATFKPNEDLCATSWWRWNYVWCHIILGYTRTLVSIEYLPQNKPCSYRRRSASLGSWLVCRPKV